METVARDDFFESLLGDFLDESGQLLDRLNENLLQLDEWVRALDVDHHQRCNEGLVNEMFRSAHSLKGLSAMLGLQDINHLTHKVENVFDAARKGELTVTGDVVELMFQAVDRLGSLVEALKDPEPASVECESVLTGIARVLDAAGVARGPSTQADAERALAAAAAELAGASVAPEAEMPPGAEPVAEAPPAPEACESAPQVSEPTPPAEPTPQRCVLLEESAVEPDQFDGLRDEAEISDKYLSIFIDEAEISLDELTETLLAMEGGCKRKAVEKLLVVSHRIKGSAASVGLNRAAKLAHLMEDLLQDLVERGGTLSAKVTDAMLKCTDGLRQYVASLRSGGRRSDTFGQLARELLAAQGHPEGEAAPAKVEAAPEPPRPMEAQAVGISEQFRAEVAAAAVEGLNTYVGEVAFRPALALVGLKARLIYEKLTNLGEVSSFDPPADRLDEMEELDHVWFGVSTDRPAEWVARQLRIGGVQRVVVEPVSARSNVLADKSRTTTAKSVTVNQPTREAVQPTRAAAAPAPRQQTTGRASRDAAESSSVEACDAPGKGRPSAAPPAETGSRPTETLRVDIERLDQLMNLAGQLVINKARFARICDSLRTTLSHKHSSHVLANIAGALDKIVATGGEQEKGQLSEELQSLRLQARRIQNDLEAVRRDVELLVQVRNSVNDLSETIHQLDRVTDGIQRSVMDTRMVQIGPLFARFKRVVRDITRSNGKSIRLVIKGEKTELDKRMIDELSDPLIHMVRNSADHGIESPEVRETLGKPSEGTITLDAFHRGNSIVIQVTDDGKGLDADRILQKALDKGMLAPAEAEKMTRQQIYQLIWEPGLSTAEKVTEVSGRGMGMDIVKSKIDDLNGSVELDSVPGQGTTITIKLPLTLAILPSLMVEIGGDVFAMPIEAVAEIVAVRGQDVGTVHGQWTARVRGRVISMVQLHELFQWNVGRGCEGLGERGETTLVIVGDSGHEIGLAVDRVLGEEDVVIKSMAENYRNVPGVAGASILGDGRVSLILDPTAVLEMASGVGSRD